MQAGWRRKTADWLYYLIEYFKYTVISHILVVYCYFVSIFRLLYSLKGDNKYYLSILFKQNYNVFCLTDKIVQRTACGSQGTYWKTPALSEVVSSLASAVFFTKRERGDGEPQAVRRADISRQWYNR